jgi:glucose dehydrogenase
MRGHLYALRAADGTVAWSFAGTAGPGQPGHGSWKGSSWQLGGGDVWMAPAVDPQLGLIYLAVANPQPRVDGAVRAGNDLYTNSLVAIRWDTGKLAWYFQSVHHDLWDYDDTMSPVIAAVRYPAGVPSRSPAANRWCRSARRRAAPRGRSRTSPAAASSPRTCITRSW